MLWSYGFTIGLLKFYFLRHVLHFIRISLEDHVFFHLNIHLLVYASLHTQV